MTWRKVADSAKGWLAPEEAEELYALGLAADPRFPIVELGTYCGKSTMYLGAAAREIGTVLFTVDHHRGSPEMAPGQDCHDPEMVGPDGHDSLPFLRANLHAAGLEESVFPVVGPSATVGRYWGTDIGLLFIDAGHDEASVRADVDAWVPHVRGSVAFHDATIGYIGAIAGSLGSPRMVGCMMVVDL